MSLLELWFRILKSRTENIHWNNALDNIPYLLTRSNCTQFLLKWLLMAESIWKPRNSIIFTGGCTDIETISTGILLMTSIYSHCLGILSPLPPFAACSVQEVLPAFQTSLIITIDAGFNGSSGTYSWAAILWSNKNLPYFVLSGTGRGADFRNSFHIYTLIGHHRSLTF